MQKLERGKPLNEALQRLMISEVDATIDIALPASIAPDTVKRLRIAGKKLRAHLRLLQKPLGDSYRNLDSCLHDALRPLAACREPESLHETLASLTKDDRVYGELAGFLPHPNDSHEVLLATFREAIHAVRAKFDFTDMTVTRNDIAKAVGRAYERNLKTWAVAQADPSDAAFHAWRKVAKRLHYQLNWLKDVLPADLRQLDHDLKAIYHALGRAHDLAVLRTALLEASALEKNETAAVVATQAKRHLKAARRRALRLALRVYRASPACVSAEIAGKHRKSDHF